VVPAADPWSLGLWVTFFRHRQLTSIEIPRLSAIRLNAALWRSRSVNFGARLHDYRSFSIGRSFGLQGAF